MGHPFTRIFTRIHPKVHPYFHPKAPIDRCWRADHRHELSCGSRGVVTDAAVWESRKFEKATDHVKQSLRFWFYALHCLEPNLEVVCATRPLQTAISCNLPAGSPLSPGNSAYAVHRGDACHSKCFSNLAEMLDCCQFQFRIAVVSVATSVEGYPFAIFFNLAPSKTDARQNDSVNCQWFW